jgi:hypothetical protein
MFHVEHFLGCSQRNEMSWFLGAGSLPGGGGEPERKHGAVQLGGSRLPEFILSSEWVSMFHVEHFAELARASKHRSRHRGGCRARR